MNCKFCSSDLLERARYCQSCGARTELQWVMLSDLPSAPRRQSQSHLGRRGIGGRDIAFAFGGVVALIVLITAVALTFPSDDFSPGNFPCHEGEALVFMPDESEKTQCVSPLESPKEAPLSHLREDVRGAWP